MSMGAIEKHISGALDLALGVGPRLFYIKNKLFKYKNFIHSV